MGKLFDVLALLADQGPDSLSWNKKVGNLLLLSLRKSTHHNMKTNHHCVKYVPSGGLESPDVPTGVQLVGGRTACWWGMALAGGTPYKLLGCDE